MTFEVPSLTPGKVAVDLLPAIAATSAVAIGEWVLPLCQAMALDHPFKFRRLPIHELSPLDPVLDSIYPPALHTLAGSIKKTHEAMLAASGVPTGRNIGMLNHYPEGMDGFARHVDGRNNITTAYALKEAARLLVYPPEPDAEPVTDAPLIPGHSFTVHNGGYGQMPYHAIAAAGIDRIALLVRTYY